jgi:chorismate mutase
MPMDISKNHPTIIAGPCSIETPDQLDQTVKGLVDLGVKMIRGGVWKPRTRPGSFEGLGEIAFPWIQEVKEKYQVQFAIEVASHYHVEIALKNNIDMLWIGARSTVNPFTVQEIANALEGSNVPIYVKNPVNPDLALWLGALERISKSGERKIGAIHRGFSNFNDKKYRNSPMWQIPLALKTEFPDLEVITDPSHICGKRDTIPMISQMALDLNFDGLMIESHIQPALAWSDAAQQLTPEATGELLKSLTLKKSNNEDPRFQSQLEEIREKIDHADREILEALSRRMFLVEEVGKYKKENEVAVFQRDRWKEVFESRTHWAKDLQVDPDFVKELYELIHAESIRKQTEVVNKRSF